MKFPGQCGQPLLVVVSPGIFSWGCAGDAADGGRRLLAVDGPGSIGRDCQSVGRDCQSGDGDWLPGAGAAGFLTGADRPL